MTTNGRYSKRGKNPGVVDAWLDSLGYYRKNIAYDETCLFRAASEQLFYTQIKHEEIRGTVIEYAYSNYNKFRHLIHSEQDWYNRLQQLEVHMVVCSEIEIQLICSAYRTDVIMFDSARKQRREFKYNKNTTSEKVIQICKLGEDHFDAVYDKDHIVNTGFCQSIVYSVLYENVFELPNVSSTVNAMLHEKDGSVCIYYSEDSNNEEEFTSQNNAVMLAPFPFKVAKALDPNMYRNIEYDSWLETRREFRLGEWYYGDDNLILGTSCLVTVNSEELQCYIQKFLSHGKCVVFVTKLAQRMTVNYKDLKREFDAKPWPLPYRFARSSVPFVQYNNTPEVVCNKGFRKRRDKKTLEILEINNNVDSDNLNDTEPNTLEGCPLVKQTSSDGWSAPPVKLNIPNDNSASHEDWSDVSEVQPCSALSSDPEFYLNLSDTAAPLPETTVPEIYQGLSNDNTMAYNSYNQDYNYSSPVWSNPQYTDAAVHDGNTLPLTDTGRNSQQRYMYYSPDSAYSSPIIMTPVPPMNYGYANRSVSNTPLTPGGHPICPFVFSPIPLPTTPVYYPQAPPPPPPPPPPPHPYSPMISSLPATPTYRLQDYAVSPALSSPMPIYNSPFEVQYYATPPLPHAPAWSYPHLNPQQGFVFPAPYMPN